MKPQWKLWALKLNGASRSVNTLLRWEGDVPCSRKRAQSTVWNPPISCPICLFIWLFLIRILYNKTVTWKYSASLGFVCHSSELPNLKEPWKTLNVKPVVQKCKGPGDTQSAVSTEVRAVLLRTTPSNLRGLSQLRWLASEWYGKPSVSWGSVIVQWAGSEGNPAHPRMVLHYSGCQRSVPGHCHCTRQDRVIYP